MDEQATKRSYQPPPKDSIHRVRVEVYGNVREVEGEQAERIRSLFIGNRLDLSGTKWMYWGQLELIEKNLAVSRVSVFFIEEGHLGAFKVNEQYYVCTSPNQLNKIVDYCDLKVRKNLIPINVGP